MPLCLLKQHGFPSFLIYRYFMEYQFSTSNVTVNDDSVRIPFTIVATSNNTTVINHFFTTVIDEPQIIQYFSPKIEKIHF